MNLINRLLAVFVVVAFALLLNDTRAEAQFADKPAVTDAAAEKPAVKKGAAKKGAAKKALAAAEKAEAEKAEAVAAAVKAAVAKAAVAKAAAEKAAAVKAVAQKAAAEKAAEVAAAAKAEAEKADAEMAEKIAAEKAEAEAAKATAAAAKATLANTTAIKFDFSNEGLKKAREEAGAFVAKGPPPGPRIIEDASYFLDRFQKEYDVTDDGESGKQTMAGQQHKVMACLAIASTMRQIANAPENTDQLKTMYSQWSSSASAMLLSLSQKVGSETLIDDVEKQVWEKFLNEWLGDVEKSVIIKDDPSKFKDALLQAAFEITKAALEIQTAQETEASSKKAGGSAGGSGSTGGAGSGNRSGAHHADVIHARLMNGIDRRHGRNTNKIQRISARK